MADDAARQDVRQGTLDLLVLRVVALEPTHGYRIAQRIQQISQNAFLVRQGSLYPALHRLEEKGWLKADVAGHRPGARDQGLRHHPGGPEAARDRAPGLAPLRRRR